MKAITDLAATEAVGRSVAIGTFDGVHVGHQHVIGTAIAVGREQGLRTAVVTFDRHPRALLAPEARPRLLTPPDVKRDLIAALGADELVILRFDAELARLPAETFCRLIVAERLRARVVVVGANFSFGAGGAGTPELLRDLGEELGYRTIVVPLVNERGRTISSSRVRALLRAGKLDEVREILGRPPSTHGVVVHGDERGRTLGVPTANIEAQADSIFPGRGVYAARARIDDSWYRAAVNVGHNPTFKRRTDDTTTVHIEAFLLGFRGDIYGQEIRVDFLAKIRDELTFESVEYLVARMRQDIGFTATLDDPAYDAVGLGYSRRGRRR